MNILNFISPRILFLSLILLSALELSAQCEFDIRPTSPGENCYYAISQVVWTDLVNVQVTGQELEKNAGGNNNWNAAAYSTFPVYDQGYAETTVQETNRDRMFGLSDTNTGSGINGIDFAFYLRSNGDLRVYENGTDQRDVGGYSTNDVLRIEVDGGAVKFYQNGTLLYVSTTAPSLPLYVDVSIEDQNGTIDQAVIANGTDGTFETYLDVPGTGATYAWFRNATQEDTGTSYSPGTLNDGDILYATALPGTGGCSASLQTSNEITIAINDISQFGSFYLTGTADAAACKEAIEEVTFTGSENIFVNGNDLVKGQGGNNNWNAGTYSLNTVSNNGYLEFVAGDDADDKMIGISNDIGGNGFSSIDHAFYLRSNDDLRIYENGVDRGDMGSYTTGDLFRIAVEDGVVTFYQNSTLLYVSTDAPTLPLIVDVSMEDEGATLNDIIVSNGNTGSFSANATNAGSNPSYQWQLNGIDLPGETAATYTNTTLTDGDLVTCVITPDLAGCTSAPFTSTAVTINDLSVAQFGTFYVENTAATSACKEAIEEATFTNAVNMFVSGNDLVKGQGGNNNWNAGANSLNTVKDNGYLEFVAAEDADDKMIGISNDAGGSGFGSIDFAFYLRSNDDLRIYENGSDRGDMGSYTTGDLFRIAVEDGVVRYYQNGTLLYQSNDSPTLPLLVDVSMEDEGAAINDLVVSNGNTGIFSAIASNAGSNPGYQWQLNGIDLPGETGAGYTNTTLSDGDIITCVITPDLGGCSDVTYTSAPVLINDLATAQFGTFYVENTAATSACKEAIEEVTFTGAVNIFVSGNNLIKGQGGNNSWNAGTYSLNTVKDNGYLQFTAAEDADDKMIGISNDAGAQGFNSIDFAFYLRSNDDLRIYENGADRGDMGSYSVNDVFKITVEDGVVHYYQNGTLLYVSTDTPTLPLLVDVSMEDEGAAINDIQVSNGNTGVFTAIASNAGTSPGYQWQLNGSDLPGENAATYTNTVLNDGDVITCVIIPDLGGCSDVPYTSLPVQINDLATAQFGTFYVENTAATSACKEAIEEVTFTGGVNIFVSGNNVIKGQGGNNNWNAAAYSLNTVKDNGYLEFTAGENANDKMMGISNDIGGSGFGSIDFAFYMRSNNDLRIYENGSDRGDMGSYTAGDVFKIAVEDGVVKYYQNGTLLYVSNDTPILPLLVDLSLQDEGAAINDIVVSNGNTGVFTAIATDAGASPTYQWQLNGSDLPGENAATYTNTVLNDGDIVTCVITPDLGGCSNVSYTSAPVIINDLDEPLFGTYYIQNDPVQLSADVAFEEITWTDPTNLFVSGNTLTKGQGGNNNWNAGAFSLNSISNYAYAQTVITQTNEDRAFGLSDTDAGVGFNGIDYKFYLRSNGQLRIYEGTTDRGAFGTLSVNDTLKIGIVDGDVVYYNNQTLLYTSTITPPAELFVDVSIEDQGGVLSDVQVVSLTDGDFQATVFNAGSNPTYQWKLNGVDVGSNSPLYSNALLADQDVITLELIPDIGGCSTISNPYVSNEILIEADNPILPVELISFTAVVTKLGVEFNWATATEKNNDVFTLSKSDDGEYYSAVTEIKGQGTTDERSTYQYFASGLLRTRTYFKLQQTDFDGTFSTLGILRLEPHQVDKFRITNNPATDGRLTFEGDLEKLHRIIVATPDGKQVASFEDIKGKSMDISSLRPGLYIVTFDTEDGAVLQRVVVK